MNIEEDDIVICKIEGREEIPSSFFNKDKELCRAIKESVERNNQTPIFIDRNVAIFENHSLLAFYKNEVIVTEEEVKH